VQGQRSRDIGPPYSACRVSAAHLLPASPREPWPMVLGANPVARDATMAGNFLVASCRPCSSTCGAREAHQFRAGAILTPSCSSADPRGNPRLETETIVSLQASNLKQLPYNDQFVS